MRRRRAGREHFLSFNAKPLDDLATWVESQRAFWASRLDALEAALQAEDAAVATTSRKKGRNR